MGRRLLVFALVLGGCGSSEPEPRTRMLARSNHMGRVLRDACASIVFDLRFAIEYSLPRDYSSIRYSTCSFGARDGRVTGPLHVELRGRTGGGPESWRCGIRIGPDPIRGPLDIEFLFRMVADPVLAARLRSAVGPIDPSRAYRVMLDVDGVFVHLEQFGSLDGPQVDLRLDACGRIPPRDTSARPTHELGPALAFRPYAPR